MIVRLVSLVVATGCASLSARAAVTEGRTSDGISYDVRGSGPTVVLIHGGVLDRRMWDHEAEAWASQFRVVRYDLRGHGKSADLTVPYSSVDDLASVLDATGASRAHLVGLSKGGQVALDFALTHPNRVDRLVLVAAAPSGARGTERVPGVDSLVAAVRRGGVEHAAAAAADMPAFAAPPNRAEWVRSLVMANARLFRQSPRAERPIAPPAMTRLGEDRSVGRNVDLSGGARRLDGRQAVLSGVIARGKGGCRDVRPLVADAGRCSRRGLGSIRLTALRPCRTFESVSPAGTEPAAELWDQPATQFIRFSHAPCAVSRCDESGRLHRRAER